MSRIGNKAISVPQNVTVDIKDGNNVTVKGPKGELSRKFDDKLDIILEDGTLTVKRPDDSKRSKQMHGTTRALLNNMVVGVSDGFKKELELVGIGFRTAMKGNKLTMNVGFSHPVEIDVEKGLTVTTPNATTIVVEGIDKQQVGEFAANVRKVKKPEPYKGKGIRYKGEHVRRKEGKTAGKK